MGTNLFRAKKCQFSLSFQTEIGGYIVHDDIRILLNDTITQNAMQKWFIMVPKLLEILWWQQMSKNTLYN